ncbi:MAG: sulfite exporter TauE/SafE family protein [Magnetococcales bacterium]|nr:sulfite exporter TauE/SafE family protein [Magnetococcales bacterium]
MSEAFLIELWLTFLTALLASGHCIGMCGGLVVAYTIHPAKTGRGTLKLHLLYGLGRVSTYVMLGAVSGWIGSVAFIFGRPQSLAGVPHFLAGMVMIWMGLDSLGLLKFNLFANNTSTNPAFFHRLKQKLISSNNSYGSISLGILTGFLPCTLHWAFQAKAMASGSVGQGMATLLAFGLGTLPAMWGFGIVSSWLGSRARQRLLQLAGLIIIIMGVMLIKAGLTSASPFTSILQ